MSNPVRMCVCCRKRLEQGRLHRLQCDKERSIIVPFRGIHRSFYLCTQCLDDKKLVKKLGRVCKTTESDLQALIGTLKEKSANEQG